ncbi:ABC transporter [Akanthomyces lecanii RCEF 1005]|uniref:ABC transporter n=1 Tax=Akanthomyces lecanii RCEF 1005 TaxID=1081108 RepID=A0A162LRF1_CORDF|nr:ABC transporter [Akanthomyces lecanii RCEF 1005]
MTWTALETALGSLSRLRMFLDDTPVGSTTDDARPLPDNWPCRGEVQISNVTARYVCDTEKQRRSPVLRDVTLSVEAGKKVGITGRTGSGKSSLLMTLLGFLEYEGSIFVDGIDLRTVSREDLRSRIITISQDQVELDGTIRDNLLPFDKTWGVDDDGATSEDASDQAGEEHRRSVHDGVLQDTLIQLGIWQSLDHENPLDMLLSAAGFSHGETQLMCIARAVIRRRVHGGSLVLVDEATGGLDGWRDQAVREMMREYFHGCTIIIVAHRAESIADTQMHVRMTDGRIVERKNLSSMI